MNGYTTIPNPSVYSNSPTTSPSCEALLGTLSYSSGPSLFDSYTGDSELGTSKVLAWDGEVSIAFITPSAKVKQVNLFFYNIPSSAIGLPPAELFWSNSNPLNPDIPLSPCKLPNPFLPNDCI